MKLRTQITLALLVAAVAAPAAHAGSSGTMPNHRASTLAATSWATPDLAASLRPTHGSRPPPWAHGRNPPRRGDRPCRRLGGARPRRALRPYPHQDFQPSAHGRYPPRRGDRPHRRLAMPDLAERYRHSPRSRSSRRQPRTAQGSTGPTRGSAPGGMLAIMLLVSIAALAARQGRRRLGERISQTLLKGQTGRRQPRLPAGLHGA